MLALTLLAVEKGIGPFEDVVVLVTPSGNYVTDGDTFDITTLYGQTDPAGRTIDSSSLPLFGEINGLGAIAGTPNAYRFCSYADPGDGTAATPLTPATCKMQVYAGITEAAGASAYVNSVLSDRIIAKLTFQGQQ